MELKNAQDPGSATLMGTVAFPRKFLYRERLQQQNGDMRKRDKV
jgi:hypothetical protein